MTERILFISQYAGFIGGLEKYVWNVSRLLRANGYKTAALFVEKTKYFDEFKSGFDEIFDMSEISAISEKDFSLTTLHKISNADTLSKILEKFSPVGFVHDHDYFCPKGFKYFPYKRLNCKRPYAPIFCALCASAVPPRHYTKGIASMFEKNFSNAKRLCALEKSCRKFAVLSKFMKNELEINGIDEDKIKVIHPFIEMPQNRDLPKNEIPQIIFAAQQVMSKGTPLFLEALCRMKSKAEAHVLGHGIRLEDFKNLADKMGLSSKIFFEGWIENTEPFFKRADISVFPSLWQEPFGLSGIEAMSYGIPVVGFDVGGVSEWLMDNFNGILVEERNTGKMAEALDILCGDSDFRMELGIRAREYVAQNYSPDKFTKTFSDLL